VERQSAHSSKWTKLTKDPISELQLELTDLKEKEEYDLRVSALNAAGQSKPTATGKFTAKDPFDKPGKPGTPEVGEIVKGEASISWTAPESDGGAQITDYFIEKRVNRGKWEPVAKESPSAETSAKIPGLKEGDEVEFRVSAENKAGRGPASSPSKPFKFGEYCKHSME
jgi:titin